MKRAMIVGWGVVLLGFLGVSFSYGANTIKVGFVDTYSGPPSIYTFDVVDAFKMAIQTINAKGGVLGKRSNIRLGTRSLIRHRSGHGQGTGDEGRGRHPRRDDQ